MNNSTRNWFIFILLAVVLILSIVVPSRALNTPGPNYKNVTVNTYVNITNAKPEVLSVRVYQDTNVSLRNITVSAGSLRLVTCNATVRDWNGYTDIVRVNATLYHISSSSNASDDNNTHYTNSSCTFETGSGNNASYNCGFQAYYYANNGTWTCNVSAIDTYNKSGSNFNTTTFLPVYALNVTDGINYGNVAVEDTSNEVQANVTNFGNMNINVTVEGYGAVRGDGLAMNCSLSGNITVQNQRFAIASGAFGTKTNLSSSAQQTGLTIPKQTLPGTQMSNSTYWQLYVPPNPGGNCTGYVIFSAEAP